ncbi:hypothetical protein J6590_039582 [Homalodisca vitripennis]|nr:hypothetical protein J6590_039582 [Homalodisca vitripennis]
MDKANRELDMQLVRGGAGVEGWRPDNRALADIAVTSTNSVPVLHNCRANRELDMQLVRGGAGVEGWRPDNVGSDSAHWLIALLQVQTQFQCYITAGQTESWICSW